MVPKGAFTYYVITRAKRGGRGFVNDCLHVLVSNETSVKLITEEGGGLKIGQHLIT